MYAKAFVLFSGSGFKDSSLRLRLLLQLLAFVSVLPAKVHLNLQFTATPLETDPYSRFLLFAAAAAGAAAQLAAPFRRADN